MTAKQRLMVNSASGLVERFANLAVQIWLYQYLIKRISPAEYSLYPVVTALLVFVPPLLAVLTSGLGRDTVEAHARNDDHRVTEITSTIFPVLLAAAIGLALLALVAAKYLGSILKIAAQDLSEARLMVLLLFGSLSLRLIQVPFGVGLYVREKFVLLNGLNIAYTIIRVGLLFGLLLGAGPRVLWVVVASVGSDVSASACRHGSVPSGAARTEVSVRLHPMGVVTGPDGLWLLEHDWLYRSGNPQEFRLGDS